MNTAIPVSQAGVDTRAAFIARTYAHLFAAILLFVGIELALFEAGYAQRIAATLAGVNWLFVLGGFMVVAWLARGAAHGARSLVVQYLALVGFVAAEAVIFVPLLFVAKEMVPGAIENAALVTLLAFAALTAVAFITRKDFSFLGAVLRWVGLCALLFIVAGVFLGFTGGVWFPILMVLFAGGAILYDTSNVLHHTPADRHVAAALELFASVALMFWYVLQLFLMSRD
jgi:FtsH-binding integral membrane protein